jgi:hypothetical protein
VLWPSAIKSTGLTVVVSTPIQEAAETTLKGCLPAVGGGELPLHVQCLLEGLLEAFKDIREAALLCGLYADALAGDLRLEHVL